MSSADQVSQYLLQFAYQPEWVYAVVCFMMLLSTFGFPLPEEVTLLTLGFIAYMGANPEFYPPPYPGAETVHPTTAAVVASVAVFSTDFMIYCLGRFGGRKVLDHPTVQRIIPASFVARAERFTQKYGSLATGIFRFTPGVRFPGHLLCGALKFPAWKFALIDGLAVLLSVPTQILLVAHYGEHIFPVLREFKVYLFMILGLLLAGFIAWKMRQKYSAQRAP
ncbi:MAG: VTT domain-containing protein [Bdellovibrionaceae bacterium]|nr:VTT domain-containing protein [Pseudobdellovibrionaceae bacterium]